MSLVTNLVYIFINDFGRKSAKVITDNERTVGSIITKEEDWGITYRGKEDDLQDCSKISQMK